VAHVVLKNVKRPKNERDDNDDGAAAYVKKALRIVKN
jgi:hypothetical protein